MSDLLRLSRRRVLGAGVLGAGALLVGCGGDDTAADAGGDNTSSADSGGQESGQDATAAALAAAGLEGATVDHTVIVASFEVLTGADHRMAFGLLNANREPALDQQLQVFVVRSADKELVQGPIEPTFYGEGLGPRGVYVFETDIPTPGVHDLIVATADGAHAGTAAMSVIEPENSLVLTPGDEIPAVDTPTVDDPKDLAELCTREPDCTMHDVTLEQALSEGRPTVLVIATPKYCQTAICGPVVDVVEELKQELSRDDIAWIHCEVFVDAGNTPTEIVNTLQLPSEPWTFVIGADGTVSDRFDGPVVPSLLRASIEAV